MMEAKIGAAEVKNIKGIIATASAFVSVSVAATVAGASATAAVATTTTTGPATITSATVLLQTSIMVAKIGHQ